MNIPVLQKKEPIQDKSFLIAEIIDKHTKKSEPGILLLEPPFKNVVVLLKENGQGEVLNAPAFVKDDKDWQDLLQKKIENITKLL